MIFGSKGKLHCVASMTQLEESALLEKQDTKFHTPWAMYLMAMGFMHAAVQSTLEYPWNIVIKLSDNVQA